MSLQDQEEEAACSKRTCCSKEVSLALIGRFEQSEQGGGDIN